MTTKKEDPFSLFSPDNRTFNARLLDALKRGDILPWIMALSAAMAAHFNGIDAAKTYADTQIKELRTEIIADVKEIKKAQVNESVDIAVIKTTLERIEGQINEKHP